MILEIIIKVGITTVQKVAILKEVVNKDDFASTRITPSEFPFL